jgi:hypothetical protein
VGKKVQKSSGRWLVSPLAFLVASGLVALVVTKGEVDYPFLLITGLTTLMYIHPKWKEWPDSLHNTVILLCVAVVVITAIWILHLFFVKKNKNI